MLLPRRSCFWLLLSLLLLAGFGRQVCAQSRYAVADTTRPVGLFTLNKETFLVTRQSVWQLQRKQFVRRYQSPAPIRCATATDSQLWLGTAQGVVRLSPRRFQPRPLSLPIAETNVTTLFGDAMGAVWLGTDGAGLFRYAGDTVQQMLQIPAINTGLATADSAVWIGTNLGLHRWQHQQWTRYNEEGVANHEIPDNLVEKLLPDNAGNLWVLMSAGISVFACDANSGAELPTVTFLGRPGNAVHSVVYLRGTGHLFATDMGLLLLPEAAGPLAQPEPTTDQITPRQLLVPVATATTPYLAQLDGRQRVWLVGTGEVSVWSRRALQQLLPSKSPQPKHNTGLTSGAHAGNGTKRAL